MLAFIIELKEEKPLTLAPTYRKLAILTLIFIIFTLGIIPTAQAEGGIIFPDEPTKLTPTEETGGSVGAGPGSGWSGQQDNDEPSWFQNAWNSIRETAGDLWNGVRQATSDGWDRLREGAGNAWDRFNEWMNEQTNGAWEPVGEYIENYFEERINSLNALWEFITSIPSAAADLARTIGQWIGDLARTVGGAVRSGAVTAWDWVTGVWDSMPKWLQDLLKTVAAIVIVVAVLVALFFAGLIVIKTLIIAAVGAIIAALVYYALFGGTDQYSFLGALTATILGAFAALGAVRHLQLLWNMFRVSVNAHLARGLLIDAVAKLLQTKILVGAAKLFGVGFFISGGYDVLLASVNFFVTGTFEFDLRESFVNACINGLLSALTFGLANGFRTGTFAQKLNTMGLGGAIGASLEMIRSFATGQPLTPENLMAGAVTGGMMVPVGSIITGGIGADALNHGISDAIKRMVTGISQGNVTGEKGWLRSQLDRIREAISQMKTQQPQGTIEFDSERFKNKYYGP